MFFLVHTEWVCATERAEYLKDARRTFTYDGGPARVESEGRQHLSGWGQDLNNEYTASK